MNVIADVDTDEILTTGVDVLPVTTHTGAAVHAELKLTVIDVTDEPVVTLKADARPVTDEHPVPQVTAPKLASEASTVAYVVLPSRQNTPPVVVQTSPDEGLDGAVPGGTLALAVLVPAITSVILPPIVSPALLTGV